MDAKGLARALIAAYVHRITDNPDLRKSQWAEGYAAAAVEAAQIAYGHTEAQASEFVAELCEDILAHIH